MFEEFLLIMIFLWPAFMLPVILGSLILRQYGHDPLGRMAGMFSMKPLAATPLWALIFAMGDRQEISFAVTQVISWVPAILLTLLLAILFRRVFSTDRRLAWVLIGMDAVRWLNTFTGVALNRALGGALSTFYLAGIIIANAYPVVALIILWVRARGGDREQITR
jgi:hypothetical protein